LADRNERTVTIDHVAGVAVRHPLIVEVGHHYGVTIATCVPADPESKGGESLSIASLQDWPGGSFADGEIEGTTGSGYQRDGGALVALADDLQRAVTAFEAEVLDVGTAGFTDAEPIEAQQHGQRGVHRRDPLGRVEESGELPSIHTALR
jgi:hypothetical protein